MNDPTNIEAETDRFRVGMTALRDAIQSVIVGQQDVVDGVLTTLLADSHVLLEGVPGLGKTLLVRTVAESLGLDFSRIQFTPDLMPADITGTMVLDSAAGGSASIRFAPGPLFAQIVLADEINRATPKTQSALLEAMQEGSVTVGRTTHRLATPHMVLATQNPLEMEGTYPLPEAQLDRFFFKLHVPFPEREQLHSILERTARGAPGRSEPVVGVEDLLHYQALVRQVPIARIVQDYAVRLVLASRPGGEHSTDGVNRYVREGPSPRGAQALVLASKIRALLQGRYAVGIDDVRASALPALRHRLLLSFEGQAEGIATDAIVQEVLENLPES